MSGRKRSGAQNRKRKKEAEIAFKKSSVLLAAFLKKAKKEVEAANTSSSESENGGYQPSVLEHDVGANVENIAVSEKNIIQTDISVCAERNSENTEDRETQHSDEPVESNGEDNISGREAANNNTHYDVQSDVVPDVLKFHDVGYVGSVVEWLKHRTDDQHGLGSKPTYAILLCPWERHFTALSPAWWS